MLHNDTQVGAVESNEAQADHCHGGRGPGHLEGVEQRVGSWALRMQRGSRCFDGLDLACKQENGWAIFFPFLHDEPDDSIH